MKAQGKRTGFFRLDFDEFLKIQKHQLGIDAAATYLALLVGTDASNVLTPGGVNSVRNYTGLTRGAAMRAIDRLVAHGLIEKLPLTKVKTKTEPRYRVLSSQKRDELGDKEQVVIERLRAGQQPSTEQEKAAAFRAARKGWIRKVDSLWELVEEERRFAYIPNIFVRTEDGSSHTAKLLQTGQLPALMLAVELYYKQDLLRDHGVPPTDIRVHFKQADEIRFPSCSRVDYSLYELETTGRTHLNLAAFETVTDDIAGFCRKLYRVSA